MTVWICDWTHWQGGPVPAEVIEREGFGMVKLKAGGASREGRYFEDPTFFRSAAAMAGTSMITAAYWYLMPGRPSAQAGLFRDMLLATGRREIVPWLDLEQPGVTEADVLDFWGSWALMDARPLALYTSKRFWEQTMGTYKGRNRFSVLEDARWVSTAVRSNGLRPYASQHAQAIDPAWWSLGYGGWAGPDIIQFTDNALVAGARTVASAYRGSKVELRAKLGV